MDAEVIIVGSGPASVAATMGLKNHQVLILDVGIQPQADGSFDQSIYQQRRDGRDLFDLCIGKDFEGLQNIFGPKMSPKLKGPKVRFITKKIDAQTNDQWIGFDPVLSYAQGGLAQGWGAGLYRFSDKDLSEFPIDPNQLNPFYDKLTAEIGISGEQDDLSQYFGSTNFLQEPMKLDRHGRSLLQNYIKNKAIVQKNGVFIGYPRLAILTQDFLARKKYDYSGLECFMPENQSIYNPAFSLRQLLHQHKNIKYLSGLLVTHFRHSAEKVEIEARDIKTNEIKTFCAKHLLIGAGAINTSRIVLQSYPSSERNPLPIVDNKISFTPFFKWQFLGQPQEMKFFGGAQLNVIVSRPDKDLVQGSYYGISSVLRSDFVGDMPFYFSGNIKVARAISSAFSLVQLFYPGRPHKNNNLSLDENTNLTLRYLDKSEDQVEDLVIETFRKMGYLSHKSFCQFPVAGSSIHYAGCLPMFSRPTHKFQCNVDGSLVNKKRVRIIDAANFPMLPAKNHSFTIMANALRISTLLKKELQNESLC